jgi:hypothetical protein
MSFLTIFNNTESTTDFYQITDFLHRMIADYNDRINQILPYQFKFLVRLDLKLETFQLHSDALTT